MKNWKKKYPALAAVLSAAPDDNCKVEEITDGLNELKAASYAQDVPLDVRARVLRILSEKMMLRHRFFGFPPSN